MSRYRCDKCDRTFNSDDSLLQHNNSKHLEEIKKPFISSGVAKKIKFWLIFIVVISVVIYVVVLFANAKTLPPTTASGHSESSPPSHTLRVPLGDAVQKHMLEHADGSGPPGVIINYDCESYDCDEELISELESFAEEYGFVYVAPYENLKSIIVLTKLGRVQTFDYYDKAGIRSFIGG